MITHEELLEWIARLNGPSKASVAVIFNNRAINNHLDGVHVELVTNMVSWEGWGGLVQEGQDPKSKRKRTLVPLGISTDELRNWAIENGFGWEGTKSIAFAESQAYFGRSTDKTVMVRVETYATNTAGGKFISTFHKSSDVATNVNWLPLKTLPRIESVQDEQKIATLVS